MAEVHRFPEPSRPAFYFPEHQYRGGRAPTYSRRKFSRAHLKILDAVIADRQVNHGVPQHFLEF